LSCWPRGSVKVARAGVRIPARKLTGSTLREAVDEAITCRLGAERIAAAFATAGGAAAAADELEALLPRPAERLLHRSQHLGERSIR
jgi:UDP:flavonoid glycosyltransferase YjiC (YdhE family)